MNDKDIYDVVVIGAGVSGAAQFFALSKYTDIKKVALIEKEMSAGNVNSRATSNSQTLHEGDIETNYNLEKALKIKERSALTRHYVEASNEEDLFLKGPKMVLGVGKEDVDFLNKRFEQFQSLYPKLKKMGAEEIGEIEPKVVEGREDKNIVALYNADGLTINYSNLAKSLIKNALKEKGENKKFDLALNTKVKKIIRKDNHIEIETDGKTYRTRFLSVCAGAHSMYFAKQLNIPEAKNLSLLCVAGNFYYTPKYIKTKIYTVQNPKLPFSAVHGDPDILNKDKTRFGPTTRLVFMLERRKIETITDFFATLSPVFASVKAYFRILLDADFLFYAMKHNILFQAPILGNWLFMKETRKIIPTITFHDVKKAKGQGGVRPQIVDTTAKTPLSLGEAKLASENMLFNVTPSPGATACIYNGIEDVKKISKALNTKFLNEKFQKDFGLRG